MVCGGFGIALLTP
ncbi:hypothetical protein JL827_28820 [Vibrio parahaemolyticus]|nr:hypothetical protein [Vibrio parahaemolyticus]MCI4896589.1 hypothetical protein [Vibrio parahaemolyticus]MDI7850924.1 hypothetical protein [Vibrio parahaemolyticus]